MTNLRWLAIVASILYHLCFDGSGSQCSFFALKAKIKGVIVTDYTVTVVTCDVMTMSITC